MTLWWLLVLLCYCCQKSKQKTFHALLCIKPSMLNKRRSSDSMSIIIYTTFCQIKYCHLFWNDTSSCWYNAILYENIYIFLHIDIAHTHFKYLFINFSSFFTGNTTKNSVKITFFVQIVGNNSCVTWPYIYLFIFSIVNKKVSKCLEKLL